MRWQRLALVTALVSSLLAAGGCGSGMEVAGAAPQYGGQQVVASYGGQVPAGTTVWLQLEKKVGARNRIGDRFTAEVAQDVIDTNGELLIPRGSRVLGRIVDVQPGYGSQPASIALAPESIEVAGVRQPFAATIVDTRVPTMKRIRGKDVLVGAAIGAVLGGVTKGKGGAIVGGALGAAAGTVVSLGRRGASAELPRGTRIAVRLERPIESYASLRLRRYY